MKQILFAHDGPVYKTDTDKYYGVDYNTNLKNRYLYLGDRLTFLTRVRRMEEGMRLTPIEGSDFNVVAVPDFKVIKKYYSYKRQAIDIIKSAVKKSDILIIRLPSSIGLIALKYAIAYKKKYIIELVACPWDGYFYHSMLGKIIAPYMYFKTKAAVRYAPYVMYVSNQFLQNRYPTNGYQFSCSDVTLPMINENLLLDRLDKIRTKKREDTIIIGTVGALNMKYKGQQYVIKAIKSLVKEGYQVEYHLVGGGDFSYLKELAKKRGVENHVKFVGAIPHNEVFNFMKEIDIYIQPSNVESHGRVIIEAFSTACPVIGSSTGGIPELIEDDFIFKRKSVGDLVKKIKKMINSDFALVSKNNFDKAFAFEQSNLNGQRKDYYDEFLKTRNEK
ncbi:UNVERIFIED_ORG: glycosyltransferase involved in cell wall biosynthesis [Bacillus sp. B2I3]|nr:glycosyltransferase involved in cell wall biosynthesis [Bacillus sp. B2I3]